MPVFTKRRDDLIHVADGTRILITRYRPRGLKKTDETWSEWLPDLGPSKDLHAHAYGKRGIATDQLAPESSQPLPVDQASDAPRAAAVEAQIGGTAPALARYTNGVLFGDLWRRSDLAPRDRSLVTITALIAAGQVDQPGARLG